ncbi:MAG TPA: hypothetical protein VNJ01_13700 [Bacteriovoracaceae bacterium]|nr:hypothetical protein [Bacteriovoracaceae bacterium]
MSEPYYVIGIDVMSYSQKELPDQVHAQNLLDRTLSSALKKSPSVRLRKWIDGGDGGYLLLSGDAKDITTLIELFLTELATENRVLQDDNRAFVRCAIHHDLIDCRNGELGEKFTGNAINVCARLLNGMPRTANQVVCSAKFRELLTAFNDHVESITRLRDVVDKHGNSHAMYNLKRNRLGVDPSPLEVHPDPLERFDEGDIPAQS